MKFRLTLEVILLGFVCSATACSEETGNALDPVIFESHFENNAWGFYGYECRILSSGKIERFNIKEISVLGGYQIGHVYEEQSPGEIGPKVVETMAKKIGEIHGKPEPGNSFMADFGVGQLVAMSYGPNNKSEEIILIEWGDMARVNQSDAAIELVTWMSGVFANAGCPFPGNEGAR